MHKLLAGLITGFLLGTVLVVALSQAPCSLSSATPCIGIPGSQSGMAVIHTQPNAGNPDLILPTTSGDLITKQEVAAMIAAKPSPSPAIPTLYTINGIAVLYTNTPFSNCTVELDDANGVLISRTSADSAGAFTFSVTSGKTYNVKLATQGWAGSPKQFAIINASGQAVSIKFTAYNPNYCPVSCASIITIP